VEKLEEERAGRNQEEATIKRRAGYGLGWFLRRSSGLSISHVRGICDPVGKRLGIKTRCGILSNVRRIFNAHRSVG